MLRLPAVFVLLLVVAASACSKDPEVAKREYLASGDRYFAEKKFAERNGGHIPCLTLN